MPKHLAPESPEERTIRLIDELITDIDMPHPGKHRAEVTS